MRRGCRTTANTRQAVVDYTTIFSWIAGYEDTGHAIRLYVEWPTPQPSFFRPHGVRTSLFRLCCGEDADAVRAWLSRNKAFQCLRVPTYSREKGVRAVQTALSWHSGPGSALFDLALVRAIRDEEHRRRLQAEVRTLVSSVIENPDHSHALFRLHDLEDVANVGPVGVELATTEELTRCRH
ncbi:MAG: hypothetical protein LC104_16740 [Bacteroidales bacterium]|nr:hypothetical protein [Bacteroidales bacterium]